MSTTYITKAAANEAATTFGNRSWQTVKSRFTGEELSERQSAAGKLGGRPRKNFNSNKEADES